MREREQGSKKLIVRISRWIVDILCCVNAYSTGLEARARSLIVEGSETASASSSHRPSVSRCRIDVCIRVELQVALSLWTR
jgi:hypothetical protein